MFSSSAATGLVLDIFKEYGTDSVIGLMTSLMMSSTETIFYTMSVYFMAAKVSKTRFTLKGAMLATLAGTAASVALVRLM
jgi:spore maturation protein B